jgi:molecular chaperone IbpA
VRCGMVRSHTKTVVCGIPVLPHFCLTKENIIMSKLKLQEWPFGRTAIGFNDLFTHLQYTAQNGAYPPYNLIQIDETHFKIEVAASGFTKEDLTITRDGKTLTIVGEGAYVDGSKYIHKGISSKKFTRSFALDEQIVINSASMKDGLLVIDLEQIIPDELKPKTISISS